MAKERFNDNDMEQLIHGITYLRREVKKISENMLLSVKPAFTNQETMELFGISSATLKSWRDTGILGYSQVGKIYLYSRHDIANFLKDHHYDTFKDMKSFVRYVKNK